MKHVVSGLAVAASLAVAGCGGGAGGAAGGASQIRAVGSSTVYPFAQAVSEQYVRENAGAKAPIVESTGTGAGLKLFCSGVGANTPDIANASRRIKKSEYDQCQANGVKQVVEVQIGLDGVAFAESNKGAKLALTTADVYKALAANPYGKPQTAKTWADVNPSLPAEPIRVYGPPSTSGTRDALAELILTAGCDSDPAMKALKKSDDKAHKKVCTEIREDGAYIDAGENDNLIVQKLDADPKAVGIFGFSFLEANAERLHGNSINGVDPSYESISSFKYPGARPLYIYVKGEHQKVKKGLTEFVQSFGKHWSRDGVLAKRGMVVAPDDVLAKSAATLQSLGAMDAADLK